MGASDHRFKANSLISQVDSCFLPYATAWENVEFPLLFNGKNAKRRRQRVTELLEAVGLLDWKEHRPSELSGGEQQRIALARALANDPPFLLADEPTGNLDSRSGEEIMGLLRHPRRPDRRPLRTYDPPLRRPGGPPRLPTVLNIPLNEDLCLFSWAGRDFKMKLCP